MPTPVIEIENLATYFGNTCIHKDLNLTINAGEILAIAGGSGSGKTTLLRNILMLQRPTHGSIKILNESVLDCAPEALLAIRRKIGVMFQHGALFTALTVLENIIFPLQINTDLPWALLQEVGLIKLGLVGLPASAAGKYPAELSGGMVKRVAVARALAMDPHLLLLDEPTAGLDPQSANGFDELVLALRDALGLTVVIVTHDLDTLWRVADRVAFLGEKRVLMADTMVALTSADHPILKQYFQGPRARVAAEAHAHGF